MIPPWILGTSAALAAVSVIVLAACRSSSAQHEGEHDLLDRDALTFENMASGIQSGVRTRGLHVIRDLEQFEKLWRKHMGLQLPTPPTPEVDFEESMVVAAFAGTQPTGGFELLIEEILRVPATDSGPGEIVVKTSEVIPAPDAVVTQMTTSPFHMVLVPKADGEPVHVE